MLAQYIQQGVRELDQDKLGNLLELKYHTVDDAAGQLGSVSVIRDTILWFPAVSLSGSILTDFSERAVFCKFFSCDFTLPVPVVTRPSPDPGL